MPSPGYASTAHHVWGQQWGHLYISKNGCPQVPLTDIQIRNAKPGLKPIRPGELAKRKNSQSAVTSTNGTASNSDAARFEKTV
jgi:hypothetical protein